MEAVELSEDMAGKIRKALAAAAPYVSTPEFVEAAQFLDRLSPPAPEVDEATVWTLKVLTAWGVPEHVLTEITFKTMLANARTALSELIASKDGEIAHTISLLTEERDHEIARHDEWKKRALEWQEKWQKAESELATLRAENERLKADCARLQQALAIQEGVSDSVHEALWAADKAAERNTAEPTYDMYAARMERQRQEHIDQVIKEERMETSETTPGTNAGAVEVTPNDIAKEYLPRLLQAQEYGEPTQRAILGGLILEAEARGRRDALEEARKRVWERLYPESPKSDWTRYTRDRADAAEAADDELKRLMTEMK